MTETLVGDVSASSKSLDWPLDIGTSHLGFLVYADEVDGFEGAWVRPHPGPFIWGRIEKNKGEYDWRETDKLVKAWQKKRLAILATIFPYAEWDQLSSNPDRPAGKPLFFKYMGPHMYQPSDYKAYTDWVKLLVERYDGDGIGDMPGLEYPIRHWDNSRRKRFF